MTDLGEISMIVKTFAILAIFFLQFTKKVHIPLWIIVLITLSSLALAFASSKKKEHQVYNHHNYNLLLGIAGIIVIIKAYM